MTSDKKHAGGREAFYEDPMKPAQMRLTPSEQARLKALGHGTMVKGARRAAMYAPARDMTYKPQPGDVVLSAMFDPESKSQKSILLTKDMVARLRIIGNGDATEGLRLALQYTEDAILAGKAVPEVA